MMSCAYNVNTCRHQVKGISHMSLIVSVQPPQKTRLFEALQCYNLGSSVLSPHSGFLKRCSTRVYHDADVQQAYSIYFPRCRTAIRFMFDFRAPRQTGEQHMSFRRFLFAICFPRNSASEHLLHDPNICFMFDFCAPRINGRTAHVVSQASLQYDLRYCFS